MHFHQRFGAVQNLCEQTRQGDFTPAGDDVVGEFADGLLFHFVGHFGATHDQHDFGCAFAQRAHERERFVYIPDIHAQPDDARLRREQFVAHLLNRGFDGEFDHARVRLMRAEIGQQVAQAERSVRIACI